MISEETSRRWPALLDQRGDFEAQTMDTAKRVNVTVAIAAAGDSAVSFVVELGGDSTLTVRLGPVRV